MKPALLISCLAACSAGSILADADGRKAASPSTQQLTVAVDTDKAIGPARRFWTVRVLTHQDSFTKPGFLENFKASHPFTDSINCVRPLGGRVDKLNEWFKGTQPDGSIETDFSGLMPKLQALLDAGITPRIVLDNVPWAMSQDRTVNKYGNTNPPDDLDQWHAYITAFAEALADEFGIERVKTWRFRVGTEPDLLPGHWTGTREEYFKHYAVTVDALTRIIPDADIGPGNILNPAKPPPGSKKTQMELTGDGKGWGVTLIDHLAETETRATFFAFSHYSQVNQPIILEECIRRIRERLDRYPELKELPLDIHESGIISDENKRRLHGGEGSEWAASWYAAIADIAYREGLSEIYDWGYSAQDLPIPRQLVIEMLDRMAGGQRLEVSTSGSGAGKRGVIAVKKGSSIYLMIYHHQAPRNSPVVQNITVKLHGEAVDSSQKWTWNGWTVDRDHGAWIHEFYRDCAEAGVELLPDAPNFGVRLNHRYEQGWKDVFRKNRGKYKKLAVLTQTTTARPVTANDGELVMNFELPAHCVKLVELTPAP